jgi:hypothetical protein
MPFHPTRASASGPAPYRVLLVGATGLPDRGALADAVAHGLADRTGHGVDVEVVATDVLASPAEALPPARDLSRIDAVIAVLVPPPDRGDRPAGVGPLIDGLARRLTVGAVTSVVVLPGPDAALLDRLATEARGAADALTPVVRLDDLPDGTGTDRVGTWAAGIAEATAAALIDPMVRVLPDDHYDEDLRLDAVERLPARDDRWVARFEGIVAEARAAYGTTSAALSIVDADHAHYSVRIALDTPVVRRGHTLCNRAMRTYGGLIVGDAQDDVRFQGFPDVRRGDLRFWAGHRIESEDGAPLGTLCVFDAQPREVDEQDLVALRDLAVALQRSLWDLQRTPTPA